MAQANQEAPRIRSVWETNLDEEFMLIKSLINDYPFVATDTEFPGVIFKRPDQTHGQQSLQARYEVIKLNVDALKIIQVGITLSNAAGELPVVQGTPSAWEFNMRDFDISKDLKSDASIDVLKSAGIDFDRIHACGLSSSDFGVRLWSSGMLFNGSPSKWVVFAGSYDLCYLIKMLTGRKLPETVTGFFETVKLFFNGFIDLKLAAARSGVLGGLQRVAESLQVTQVAGQHHTAGADSLRTMLSFMKLRQRFGHEKLEEVAGLIHGLCHD